MRSPDGGRAMELYRVMPAIEHVAESMIEQPAAGDAAAGSRGEFRG